MAALLEQVYDNLFRRPVIWIRETVVEPNRPKSYWYHRKYPRVTEIDECYMDDMPCQFEANEQFKRDMKVETEIVRILRRRYSECIHYEYPDNKERCARLRNEWETAELNWFIKYGDMGFKVNAREAYYKQKHRLVFERRKREYEQMQTVEE